MFVVWFVGCVLCLGLGGLVCRICGLHCFVMVYVLRCCVFVCVCLCLFIVAGVFCLLICGLYGGVGLWVGWVCNCFDLFLIVLDCLCFC